MQDGDWRCRERTVLESVRPLALVLMAALGLTVGSGQAEAQPSCPRVELTLVEPSASSETRAVKHADQIVFVRRNAITTTGDISEIKVAGDDVDTLILIKYHPTAAARLLEATTDRAGQRMAFVVDEDVLLAFTWEGPYGIGPDGTQLSILDYGLARAERLVEAIRVCTDNPTL